MVLNWAAEVSGVKGGRGVVLIGLWLVGQALAADSLSERRIPITAADLVVRLVVPPVAEVVLTLAGDLMGHNASTRMEDYSAIYRGAEPWLKADDFSFVNLETPMDDSRPWSAYPSFNVHSDYVEAAIRAGVEVFALANNHCNDFGLAALLKTLDGMEALQRRYPIHFSGLRRDPQVPWSLEIIQKNGIVIGFLSATNLVNQPNGLDNLNYVGYYDVYSQEPFAARAAQFLGQIKRLRAGVDLLILGLHDGLEYKTEANALQEAFYEDLLVAGVDILWGHHSHVMQPWSKVWKNGRFKLILPSLGNFVSGQTQYLRPRDGNQARAQTGDVMLFQIKVRKRGGETFLADPQPIFFNTSYNKDEGVRLAPTQWLIDQGPPAWRDYYKQRLAFQQQWLTPRELL